MNDRPDMSRRDLLRGRLFGRLAEAITGRPDARAGAAADQGTAPPRFRGSMPVHRPPGAIDEPTFLRDCTRCDACLDACPHDAIVPAPARLREAAGTPMIDATRQPCRMCDDTPCITACEPGVLTRAVPLVMGRSMIIDQTCLAHQGTFCTVCSEQCPVEGAIAVEAGKPRVVEDRCTGCGVCHYVCPAPQNAVIAMPRLDRPPRPAPPPAAPSASASSDTEDVVFPPMNDAMLTPAQVDQLFRDVAGHARVLDIRVKGAASARCDDRPLTLEDAEAAVTGRTARGVQLRYVYDGAVWMDTLMLSADGVRLVRVQHGPA